MPPTFLLIFKDVSPSAIAHPINRQSGMVLEGDEEVISTESGKAVSDTVLVLAHVTDEQLSVTSETALKVARST